jgi:hypothetical protein
MSEQPHSPSPLADLVDLVVQAQRDAAEPEPALHRRDRGIARKLPSEGSSPTAMLVGWLAAMRAMNAKLPGRKVAAMYRLANLLLGVLGLLAGWGVATVVFAYGGDPPRPVNVVHVLAVFVGLQLLLLLLVGFVMLPSRAMRAVPFVGALQETLAMVSPGQLATLIMRRLPQAYRDSVDELLGATTHYRWLLGLQKWSVLLAAQIFALCFNIGALLNCLNLIVFTDLAFAWSTTLEPDAQRVHELMQWLALPWGWFLERGVPDIELVSNTLYYQQGGGAAQTTPQEWGRWWPFIVASMVTYGLLPRLGLVILAGVRYSRTVGHGLTHSPAAQLVIDRLQSALIETQAEQPEADGADARVADGGAVRQVAQGGAACVINWATLPLDDAQVAALLEARWHKTTAAHLHAGGDATIEQDEQAIADAAATDAPAAIVLLVRAWEPPMLELLDFIGDLRKAIGAERLIIVAPVAMEGDTPTAPHERDLTQWRRRIAGVRDAATIVQPAVKGGDA